MTSYDTWWQERDRFKASLTTPLPPGPMTKQEFKARWESDDEGGGITYDHIAECAKAWGIAHTPRIRPILLIQYLVLKAAGVEDAEDFNPANNEEEEQ